MKTEFNNFARRSERSTSHVSPHRFHNRAEVFNGGNRNSGVHPRQNSRTIAVAKICGSNAAPAANLTHSEQAMASGGLPNTTQKFTNPPAISRLHVQSGFCAFTFSGETETIPGSGGKSHATIWAGFTFRRGGLYIHAQTTANGFAVHSPADSFNDYPTKRKGCGSRCGNVQAETGKARGRCSCEPQATKRVRATSPEYEPACYRNTGAFNGAAASRL